MFKTLNPAETVVWPPAAEKGFLQTEALAQAELCTTIDDGGGGGRKEEKKPRFNKVWAEKP